MCLNAADLYFTDTLVLGQIMNIEVSTSKQSICFVFNPWISLHSLKVYY